MSTEVATTQPVDPLKSVASAMATAAEAVRDGASDATSRVQKLGPATTQFVSRVTYSGFYFLSYGIVFPTLLVTNYVPGMHPVANGLTDGAVAASDYVKEMRAKRATKSDSSADADAEEVAEQGADAMDNA